MIQINLLKEFHFIIAKIAFKIDEKYSKQIYLPHFYAYFTLYKI